MFPLILLVWLYSDLGSAPDGWGTAIFGALVLLGPAVGFLAQQLHMFRHEKEGYASPERRTLKLIIERFREEEPTERLPSGQEALLAWDYFFHADEIQEDIRAHILRTWYFIHSFRGTAWAFGIGLVMLVAGPIWAILFRQGLTSNTTATIVIAFIAVIYFVCIVFLLKKAESTERFLWRYEELAVVEHWSAIKGYLDLILQEKRKDNQLFS